MLKISSFDLQIIITVPSTQIDGLILFTLKLTRYFCIAIIICFCSLELLHRPEIVDYITHTSLFKLVHNWSKMHSEQRVEWNMFFGINITARSWSSRWTIELNSDSRNPSSVWGSRSQLSLPALEHRTCPMEFFKKDCGSTISPWLN